MSPENLAPRRRYPISKKYSGMDECMYDRTLNERVEVSVRPEHTTRMDA